MMRTLAQEIFEALPRFIIVFKWTLLESLNLHAQLRSLPWREELGKETCGKSIPNSIFVGELGLKPCLGFARQAEWEKPHSNSLLCDIIDCDYVTLLQEIRQMVMWIVKRLTQKLVVLNQLDQMSAKLKIFSGNAWLHKSQYMKQLSEWEKVDLICQMIRYRPFLEMMVEMVQVMFVRKMKLRVLE